MNNNLFHPPESFITEGGQEDFYLHEVSKLVDGVGLDETEEAVNQQELE